MKKTSQFITVICLAGTLAACGATLNQNSMTKRIVRAKKLPNGKILTLGYKAPAPASKCKIVGSEEHNWAMEQTTGMLKMGGAYQKLQDQAMAYANQHKNVNYAFMYVPNEYDLGTEKLNVNVTFMNKASIIYYHCKVPPAVHYNPFSDK